MTGEADGTVHYFIDGDECTPAEFARHMGFAPRRKRQRHNCADYLPETVPAHVQLHDRWKCPSCRRRWCVVSITEPGQPPNPMRCAEGVEIKGADGSRYWRPFRMRLIGRIGV